MSTATVAKKVKVYHLLESLDSEAPFYQQLGDGQRSQIKKMPYHRPHLQVTLQDASGKAMTIRYKASCDSFVMQDQIEKYKIDANAKFSQAERDALAFRHGVLVTDKINLQNFLEAHPENEDFKGSCDEVPRRMFKVFDKAKDAVIKNSDMRMRVEAAYYIMKELDLDAARALLIRLNGSFFETPNTGDDEEDLVTCQNMLMAFVDDAEEAGLKAVLKKGDDVNIDEATKILIGELINADLLSFDQAEGKISKKDKTGKWIDIRDMAATYSQEERLRLFSDFLNTEDGKLLKNDLEKDLAEYKKPKAKNKSQT